MVAPVEVGEGGAALLVSDGLLKPHETSDRELVGAACLAALEQWRTDGFRQISGGGRVRLKPRLSAGITTYFDCYPQTYPQTSLALIT